MNTFSAGAMVRFGWETFKKRPWFFIGTSLLIAVLYVVIGIVTSIVDGTFSGTPNDPTLPGFIVNWLLSTIVGMGATALYLKAHDNLEGVKIGDLWHVRSFWKYLVASILITIVVAIGFVLLIVPGIIVALMLMFTTYIVIDRDRGPLQAMKESKQMTTGYKWKLFVFIVALAGLNILGALALLVGLLVTIPLSMLATVHAYRTLSAQAGAAPVTTTTASAV